MTTLALSRIFRFGLPAAFFGAAFMPFAAQAAAIPEVLDFFNLLVGLMLTVAILLFVGGFVLYLTRLGTFPTYREDAIQIMKWGVAVLFVLVVLLGIEEFLVSHLAVAAALGVLLVVALFVGAFYLAYRSTQEEEKKAGGQH